MSDNIKVVVRARPHKKSNTEFVPWIIDEKKIYQIDEDRTSIGDTYSYDEVFNVSSKNADIYETSISSLVSSAVEGINLTIFAYGATSSGKTYTMNGTQQDPGIIPRFIEHIFDQVEHYSQRKFLIRVSYVEIYSEIINDLLDKTKKDLKIREDVNNCVSYNPTEQIVKSSEECMKVMERGAYNRTVGETQMNQCSSRSHAIFRIVIESAPTSAGENDPVQVSQVNLIDLAGSERASQTGATGQRFKEGAHINKSLTALGLVIKQLVEKNEYVNYRDSKLTRILCNSLGGNAKTLIICNINLESLEDTASTLMFAQRAKAIKNKPKVNEVMTEAALTKKYAKECAEIKQLLESELEKNKQLEIEQKMSSEKISQLNSRIKNFQEMFVKKDPVVRHPKRRHTFCVLGAISEDRELENASRNLVSVGLRGEGDVSTSSTYDIHKSPPRRSSVNDLEIPPTLDKTPTKNLRDRLEMLTRDHEELIEYTRVEKCHNEALVKKLEEREGEFNELMLLLEAREQQLKVEEEKAQQMKIDYEYIFETQKKKSERRELELLEQISKSLTRKSEVDQPISIENLPLPNTLTLNTFEFEEMSEKIESYQKQIKEMQNNSQNLKLENDDLNVIVADLRKSLNAIELQNSQLKIKNKSLQTKVLDMEVKVNNSQQVADSSNNGTDALKKQIRELEENNKELKAELGKLSDELCESQDKLIEVTQDLDIEEKKSTNLEKQLIEEKKIREDSESELSKERVLREKAESELVKENLSRQEAESELVIEISLRQKAEAKVVELQEEKESELTKEKLLRQEAESELVKEKLLRQEAESELVKEKLLRQESESELVKEKLLRQETESQLLKEISLKQTAETTGVELQKETGSELTKEKLLREAAESELANEKLLRQEAESELVKEKLLRQEAESQLLNEIFGQKAETTGNESQEETESELIKEKLLREEAESELAREKLLRQEAQSELVKEKLLRKKAETTGNESQEETESELTKEKLLREEAESELVNEKLLRDKAESELAQEAVSRQRAESQLAEEILLRQKAESKLAESLQQTESELVDQSQLRHEVESNLSEAHNSVLVTRDAESKLTEEDDLLQKLEQELIEEREMRKKAETRYFEEVELRKDIKPTLCALENILKPRSQQNKLPSEKTEQIIPIMPKDSVSEFGSANDTSEIMSDSYLDIADVTVFTTPNESMQEIDQENLESFSSSYFKDSSKSNNFMNFFNSFVSNDKDVSLQNNQTNNDEKEGKYENHMNELEKLRKDLNSMKMQRETDILMINKLQLQLQENSYKNLCDSEKISKTNKILQDLNSLEAEKVENLSTIQKLKDHIQYESAKHKDLQEILELKSADLRKLNEEIQLLREDISSNKIEKDQKEKEILSKLDKEKSDLLNRINELNNENKNLINTNKYKEELIAAFKTEKTTLEEENKNLSEKISNLKIQVQSQSDEIAKLNDIIRNKEQSLQKAELDHGKLKEERNNIKFMLKEECGKNVKLLKVIEKLGMESQNLISTLKQKEDTITEINENKISLEKEKEDLTLKLNTLYAQLNQQKEHEILCNQNEEKAAQLSNRIRELEEKIDSLSVVVKDKEKIIVDNTFDKNNLEEENNNLSKQVNDLLIQVQTQKNQLIEFEEIIKTKALGSQEIIEENENLKKEHEDIGLRLEEEKEKNANLLANIEELKLESEKLKIDNDKLTISVRELSNINSEKVNEIHSIQKWCKNEKDLVILKMKNTQTEYEKEKRSLMLQISDLKVTTETQVNKMKELQEIINNHEIHIKKLENNIQEHEQDLKNKEKAAIETQLIKIKELQEIINNNNSHIKKLEQDLKNKEIAATETQLIKIKELQKVIDDNNTHIKKLEEELKNKEKVTIETELKIKELQEIINANDTHIKKLEQDLKNKEKAAMETQLIKMKELQEIINNNNTHIKKLEQDLKIKESAVETQLIKIKELQEIINNNNEHIKKLEQDLKNKEKTSSEENEKINSLEKNSKMVDDLKRENSALMEGLEVLQNMKTDLENELLDLRADFSEKLGVHISKVKSLLGIKEEKTLKSWKIQLKLETKWEELKKIEHHISMLIKEQQTTKTNDNKMEDSKMIKKLSEEIGFIQDQKKFLQATLENLKKEHDIAISEYEKKLQQESNAMKAMYVAHEQDKKKIENLEYELRAISKKSSAKPVTNCNRTGEKDGSESKNPEGKWKQQRAEAHDSRRSIDLNTLCSESTAFRCRCENMDKEIKEMKSEISLLKECKEVLTLKYEKVKKLCRIRHDEINELKEKLKLLTSD